MSGSTASGSAVAEALRRLGVRHLVLAIHDASFPGDPDQDLGRGTPGSRASLALCAFLRERGFDALQLGPQGLTPEGDGSPYMGALFSRNPLSIPASELSDPQGEWGELLPPARLAALVAARPAGAMARVPHAAVLRAQRAALGAAFERFERLRAAGDAGAVEIERRIATLRDASPWLDPDALYEALRSEYGGREWTQWTGPRAALDRGLGAPGGGADAKRRRAELVARHAPLLRFYPFVQLLAHAAHARFREALRGLGLHLFGDLQVGASPRDTWREPAAFLESHRLGAPPSRTNREGQAWEYPVLDPDGLAPDGAADGLGPTLRFVRARMEKMFSEYDAVRIDHPQGLVCPWVYRAGASDPQVAVQQGARLYASPDLPDHPELARFAIARREQLSPDPATPRHADDWVRDLDAEQVDRYARVFDVLVEVAQRRARCEPALACEVLSTLPYPLARVLERHGLGRFRVTQKEDPNDPDDVYRAENAAPRDWIMFGSHDTPPLWHLLDEWHAEGRIAARAARAAQHLAPTAAEEAPLRERLLADPGLMAQAELARIIASPAENVSVFFADLLGMSEVYNRPGTVDDSNWSLRVPPDWRARYEERLLSDRALNLPMALWLALRSRPAAREGDLERALRSEAERLRGGRPLA